MVETVHAPTLRAIADVHATATAVAVGCATAPGTLSLSKEYGAVFGPRRGICHAVLDGSHAQAILPAISAAESAAQERSALLVGNGHRRAEEDGWKVEKLRLLRLLRFNRRRRAGESTHSSGEGERVRACERHHFVVCCLFVVVVIPMTSLM